MVISVIVPCYNREKNIHKTISSLLNQKNNDYEMILVDDGSTDNTYDIIKSIKDQKKRIVTIIKREDFLFNISNNYYPPKSSKSIISSSTPKSCNIFVAAVFITGGPHK